MNFATQTIPNYYFLKGKRQKEEFISFCEDGACMRMQENGYMDVENFSKWMDSFLSYHKSRGNLSLTKRMLFILDGHKSHIFLEILLKAKTHGVDMVSLPSHTSYELQPLDISCFKSFKLSFRAYRNAWKETNIGKKVRKQELVQWVSLALKKALKEKNICACFRAAQILPLNKEAMEGKMEVSIIFHHSLVVRKIFQEDEVSSQTFEEANEIEVEEIMKECIPNPSTHYTYYFVSIEDECSYPSYDSSIAELVLSQPCSQFLKLHQIQIPISYRVRSEPIIDYSIFQILTSSDHVDRLHQILEKKANIEENELENKKKGSLPKLKWLKRKLLQLLPREGKLLNKKQEKLVDKVGLLQQLEQLIKGCKIW